MYYNFKSNEFQNSLKSKVVQAVQANISLTVIKDEKIVLPDENTLSSYNDTFKPLFNKIGILNGENGELQNLRDVLLSKLMAGEVIL